MNGSSFARAERPFQHWVADRCRFDPSVAVLSVKNLRHLSGPAVCFSNTDLWRGRSFAINPLVYVSNLPTREGEDPDAL
jgi:hypothetical protein